MDFRTRTRRLVSATAVFLVATGSPALAGRVESPPSLRDTLATASPTGARVAGDTPTRLEGTRPPEDYRTGQGATGLPSAADTQFAEFSLLDVGNANTLLKRVGFTGCGARHKTLTYVCPNGDTPDASTLGQDLLAVHLALNGPLPDALVPGTKLGFALITQNQGAAQAPSSGSLTGGSDAYRTVFSTSGSTVAPVYQFWSFPWAPVPAASDPPFNLQILDDRGAVTWLLDPAVLAARNVTGLRPKTFVDGSTIANPIPDLAPSNPTTYYPYNFAAIPQLRIDLASSTGLVTHDGGSSSAFVWWLLAGGGVLVTGSGIAMRRRRDTVATDPLDGQWAQIVTANDAAIERLELASRELGKRLGKFFADYGHNTKTFARAYSRGVHGLDILEETRKANDERIAVAQFADVVINLVQLFQVGNAVRGGAMKGWRWYRGRQVAAQNRTIVANLNRRFPELDAMTRAGQRGDVHADAALPEGFGFGPWARTTMPSDLPVPPDWFPTTKALDEAFDSREVAFWHMTQLADEVGADLRTMVNTAAGPKAALQQLRMQVAAQHGVPMIGIDDYLRLFNLDRAVEGKAAYNLEDLRWFLDAAQRDPDLMQKLGTAIGRWDAATADFLEEAKAAVDPQMMNNLNRILQNPTLADTVANTPVGMRGTLDVLMPDGTTARLYGDLSEVPTGTASFPNVLAPPVPGGPIVGIGPGQGLVNVPPTIAPGARIPAGYGGEIPPTWTGRAEIPPTWIGNAADTTPTWTGGASDIPPTWSGHAFDIPATWTGDVADITPTWTGAIPDTLTGITPPLGATLPPPAVSGLLGTAAFDGPITLPPGMLDSAVSNGVMRVDDAADLTQTFIDEGRRVLVSGTATPQLLRTLPADTALTTVATATTTGATPVVRTGTVGQFFDDVGGTIRDPWFQQVNDAIGTGEDAAFLLGTGAGAVIQGGVFGDGALVDPAGLLAVAAQAKNYYGGPKPIFVCDYGAGQYLPITLPGLNVGMQAAFTPSGVSVFDATAAAYTAPNNSVPGGLIAGFTGGVGAQLGGLGVEFDPNALAATRAELVQQTGQLMAGRDWFRTPDDYLDELDDYGVTRTDFSFVFWTVADGDSFLGEWGWNFVLLTSNPTETLLKRLPFIGLGDQMTDDVMRYYEGHGDDLADMNQSLSSMITDLEWTLEHLPEWSAPLVAAQDALANAMDDARAFGAAHPEWVANNPGELEAKLARDGETLADVAQSLSSLQALAGELAPMVNSLKELRVGPNGTFKRTDALLEPTSILRVSGSFLRLLDGLAGVLLLVPPQPDAPQEEEQRYKPTIEEVAAQHQAVRDAMPPENYHRLEDTPNWDDVDRLGGFGPTDAGE